MYAFNTNTPFYVIRLRSANASYKHIEHPEVDISKHSI